MLHTTCTMIVCSIIMVVFRGANCGTHERRLLKHLFSTYNPLERPVEDERKPLNIQFGCSLQQLIDVDEKNQLITTNIWLDFAWVDTNLKWDKAQYGNITSIRIPPARVWKPDILMYNSADESFDATYETNFVVSNTGFISYVPPGLFKSTCKIDIRWFPFDEQNCDMKFGSWTFNGNAIELVNKSYTADLSGYSPNGEWDLIEMPAVQHKVYYDCCPDTPYYDVTFTLRLRRKSLYYVFNLVVPCILISAMALLTFILPPDAGEKIGLGVTIFLSLTVFAMIVADKLPETSEAIPLIGIYFFTILFMSGLCVMFTVVVLSLHHRSPDTHEMPHWVKKGINEWLAWVLRMKRPGRELSRAQFMERAKSARDLYASQSLANNTAEMGNHYPPGHSNLTHMPHGYESFEKRASPVRLVNIKQESADTDYSSNNNSGSCARPELQLIYKEIKFISDRYRDEDAAGEETSDWVFAAMVVDRLCLFLFSIATVVATAAILLSAPDLFGNKEEGAVASVA